MNFPYVKSEIDGVWQRSKTQEFGYSDGDEAENRIAAVIREADDCSVFSDELHRHIRDWPSMYHLSSLRANLMRPLVPLLQGSVLEIGSGCGAITRFLGETAQSVQALEGSRRRAQITRLRTRDLDNVQVYCDEFSAFSTEDTFDAVTLIGVLEYANLFVQGEQPALQMLSKARERLKQNGCLIVAIENQLGLKYFAGSPEDHLGQPMVGIEDRYEFNGVRTYGKQTLTTLLRNAGFESLEFLYPFPDYKLPLSVLSQRAFEHPRFDANAFVALSAGKDPQLASTPNFSLERAWSVIGANALAPHLANSFLIVARTNSSASADPQLAWHYGSRRRFRYSKETVFLAHPQDDEVDVVRRRLGSSVEDSRCELVRQVLEDPVGYEPLPLLSEQLIDTITRTGWTDEQLGAFILKYVDCLTHITGVPLSENSQVLWNRYLAGNYYDCIPQNIRMHADGSCTAFDLEWHLTEDVSLIRLVIRTFWHTLGGLSLIGVPLIGGTPSVLEMTKRALKACGYLLNDSEAQALVQSELDLQRLITGASTPFQETWDWLTKGILRYHTQTTKLVELGQHSANLSHQLSHHQQHSNNLSHELRNRDNTLSAYQAQIAELERWQATATAELNACQRLLQARTDELSVVMRDADPSARSLRRAMFDDTQRHLLAHSPTNAVRLVQDYHRAISLADKRPSDPSLKLPWTSRVAVLWSTRPKATFMARVQRDDQIAYLLRQSCRWAFPFELCFITSDESIGQQALSAAARLDIPLRVQREPSGEQLRYQSGHPLLAIPCCIGTVGIDDTGPVALPDPERIRLAYVALACNPRLAAVVVNTKAATGGEPVALLTMVRSELMTSSQAFMTTNEQGTHEDLAKETERLRSAATSVGRQILVI